MRIFLDLKPTKRFGFAGLLVCSAQHGKGGRPINYGGRSPCTEMKVGVSPF